MSLQAIAFINKYVFTEPTCACHAPSAAQPAPLQHMQHGGVTLVTCANHVTARLLCFCAQLAVTPSSLALCACSSHWGGRMTALLRE